MSTVKIILISKRISLIRNKWYRLRLNPHLSPSVAGWTPLGDRSGECVGFPAAQDPDIMFLFFFAAHSKIKKLKSILNATNLDNNPLVNRSV